MIFDAVKIIVDNAKRAGKFPVIQFFHRAYDISFAFGLDYMAVALGHAPTPKLVIIWPFHQ
jgi:hypothetical protein